MPNSFNEGSLLLLGNPKLLIIFKLPLGDQKSSPGERPVTVWYLYGYGVGLMYQDLHSPGPLVSNPFSFTPRSSLKKQTNKKKPTVMSCLPDKLWPEAEMATPSLHSSPLLLHGLWPARLSVHGILQARILEWVAMPSSRGSSQPRDWTLISCIAGGLFTIEQPGKPKNTGMDSLSLLQGIFPTQESYWGLLTGEFCTNWAMREA